MRPSSVIFLAWSVGAFGLIAYGVLAGQCDAISCDGPAAAGRFVWVYLGSVVIFAIYRAVTRDKYVRPCPRCGEAVARGELECEACGFDFATIGSVDGRGQQHGDEEPPAERAGGIGSRGP